MRSQTQGWKRSVDRAHAGGVLSRDMLRNQSADCRPRWRKATPVGARMRAFTGLCEVRDLAGVFVFSAWAEEFLFRSAIIGSNPNTVIGGVQSGGAPLDPPARFSRFGWRWTAARRSGCLNPNEPWESRTRHKGQRQLGLRRHRRDRGCHNRCGPTVPGFPLFAFPR
jgi:hypothetical protein